MNLSLLLCFLLEAITLIDIITRWFKITKYNYKEARETVNLVDIQNVFSGNVDRHNNISWLRVMR